MLFFSKVVPRHELPNPITGSALAADAPSQLAASRLIPIGVQVQFQNNTARPFQIGQHVPGDSCVLQG